MPLIDKIVAATGLGGIGIVLAVRAARAWREYALQRRTLALMIRSVTELERPEDQPAEQERRQRRA
jgi:hypothetical protein